MARGDHAWFQKITWAEAEKIAGKRLDRRIQFYIHTPEGLEAAKDNIWACPGAELVTYTEYTLSCSGCTESGEYGVEYGPMGCRECGYTRNYTL